jgi:hypothetical protein
LECLASMTQPTNNASYVYFLGGNDLEMETIRSLLTELAAGCVVDKGLRWGAKLSVYRDEITQAIGNGLTPVAIELEDDLQLCSSRIVTIDHHGKSAGGLADTALHQVFALLGLPSSRWTRWYELVAANDRGYIPAMRAMGASMEEIARIRAADRKAQGVTAEDETAGAIAVAQAETSADGRLTVAYLSHNRSVVVADRMERTLGRLEAENLVVVSPDEINVYGAGQLVLALTERFPDCWYGGALPDYGYWGCQGNNPDVMAFVRGFLGHDRATIQTVQHY